MSEQPTCRSLVLDVIAYWRDALASGPYEFLDRMGQLAPFWNDWMTRAEQAIQSDNEARDVLRKVMHILGPDLSKVDLKDLDSVAALVGAVQSALLLIQSAGLYPRSEQRRAG